MQQNLPLAPTHLAPCACGRHANLTKMGPRARGETLGKVRSEYMVFGDFVSHSPYVYAMTAYWVPLSKLIKDVTRATAVVEIEIFGATWPSSARTRWRGSHRRTRRATRLWAAISRCYRNITWYPIYKYSP